MTECDGTDLHGLTRRFAETLRREGQRLDGRPEGDERLDDLAAAFTELMAAAGERPFDPTTRRILVQVLDEVEAFRKHVTETRDVTRDQLMGVAGRRTARLAYGGARAVAVSADVR
ncbi:MAG: hypothetical protein AAFX81_10370 [Pseudomonadota bacterium]